MKRVLVVLLAWVGVAAEAQASRYEIPLPELKGVYSTGDIAPGLWRFLPVDLVTRFASIDAIYLDMAGNGAPALFRNTTGESSEFVLYPSFSLSVLWPQQGDGIEEPILMRGGGTRIEANGPFHVVAELLDAGQTPPWDRMLLVKSSETVIIMEPAVNRPDWEQLVPAIAGITDAKLIVEGEAVPEPAGVMVLAMGGFVLLSRRRRDSARA